MNVCHIPWLVQWFRQDLINQLKLHSWSILRWKCGSVYIWTPFPEILDPPLHQGIEWWAYAVTFNHIAFGTKRLKPQLKFPGENVLISYFNLRCKSLCYRSIDPVSLLLAKVPVNLARLHMISLLPILHCLIILSKKNYWINWYFLIESDCFIWLIVRKYIFFHFWTTKNNIILSSSQNVCDALHYLLDNK